MEKESILLHKLCCDISKYSDFVLYGAGHVAEILLESLAQEKYTPLYCVVTHLKDDYKLLNGVPIYSFENKKDELKEGKILTIVAVSELYEKEILKLLKNNSIKNVILASCYIEDTISENSFIKIYREKDYKWYESKIRKWFWEKNGIELERNFFCNYTKAKNRVVFVVEHLSPRVIKIIEELKRRKQEIIVLINRNKKGEMWDKYYSSLTVNYKFYGSIEELIFLLKKYRGKVIHIFTIWIDIYIPYILVKHQEHIGKVIFETYDIVGGFCRNATEEQILLEKYCLENASGVCYREYSLEYLINNMKYNIKGKTLRFLDYCNIQKEKCFREKQEDELSICYVGGLIREISSPLNVYLDLARKCADNKCHFHIYPFVWLRQEMEDLIKEDEINSYFHLHKPISFNLLASELAQYDYGIFGVKGNLYEKEFDELHFKYKYIYTGTNKLFDYLDAGIPIISPMPLKYIQFLEEKKVLLNWTIEQYDFEHLRKMKKEMRKNVIGLREELRIDKNIDKLIEFYDSL